MNRLVVWRAADSEAYHATIECAVRADGTSPAKTYLEELKTGSRAEDPDHTSPPDAEQIRDYHQILAKIEYIGFYGEPERRGDVRHLEEGIWEFKHWVRRLSYWDTPGDGSCDPKFPIEDQRTLPADQLGDFWWYPNMDQNLRLGCAWDKDAQMAPPEKIAEALEIREEDLAHDVPQTAPEAPVDPI